MIAFASLFLGLLVGTHQVEVRVGETVAAVELRLDGEVVARLHEPPWAATVDFGARPRPAELVAVALDGLGGELGRVGQWVNVPRPPAAVEVSLTSEDGRSFAELAWESLAGAEPVAVAVTFDGAPLASPTPTRWELPAHDPAQLHFLRAEVDFEGSVTASGELVFGGGNADELQATATAVIVDVERKRELRTLDDVALGFVRDGVTLRPLAIELGPCDLVAVVTRSARRLLAAMPALAPTTLTRFREPVELAAPRFEPDLRHGPEWRLQLLGTTPARRAGATRAYDLFPHSQVLTPADGALISLLAGARATLGEGAERIADAVAVAGLTAAENSRRRAVLLLLGEDEADASDLSPEAVAGFLADLQVPLVVWSVGGATVHRGWGESEDASAPTRLERAWRALMETLDHQRVVWLAGAHLTRSLRLTEAETGKRSEWSLAGPRDAIWLDEGSQILAQPDRGAAVVYRAPVRTEVEVLERKQGWARLELPPWKGWVLLDPAAPDLGATPIAPRYAERIDATRLRRLLARVSGAEERSLGPYALYTDVRDEALLGEADALASQLAGLYASRYGLAAPRAAEAVVIVLARETDYRELARHELADQGLLSGADTGFRLDRAVCCSLLASVTYLGRSSPAEFRPVLLHELAHLMNRRTLGPGLPRWLDEGLAADLAASDVVGGRITPERLAGELEVVLGAGRTGTRRITGARSDLKTLLERWHGDRPALERVLAAGWRDLDPAQIELAGIESGFLVRYLVSDPELAPRFRTWLQSLAAAGAAAADDPLLALGVDLDDLELRFHRWARRTAQADGIG